MDDNLKIILGEFEKMKGQFVVTDSWAIERLVAIGSDKWDYYYVTYNGRKLTWNTCVGKVIQLKGKIDNDDYNSLVAVAKLNHYDQEGLYNIEDKNKRRIEIQQHRAELMSNSGSDEFITEVCWELN